jgi:hypothetical protein
LLRLLTRVLVVSSRGSTGQSGLGCGTTPWWGTASSTASSLVHSPTVPTSCTFSSLTSRPVFIR